MRKLTISPFAPFSSDFLSWLHILCMIINKKKIGSPGVLNSFLIPVMMTEPVVSGESLWVQERQNHVQWPDGSAGINRWRHHNLHSNLQASFFISFSLGCQSSPLIPLIMLSKAPVIFQTLWHSCGKGKHTYTHISTEDNTEHTPKNSEASEARLISKRKMMVQRWGVAEDNWNKDRRCE